MDRLSTPLTAALACVAALLIAALPAPALAEPSATPASGRAATVGSGTLATQLRSLEAFDAIRIAGSFKVRVRQTGRETVEVRADDNLLPLIETVVEADGPTRTLHLRWKRGETIRTRHEVSMVVEVARLEAVASHGSGDVTIEPLKTPALALSLAGSGDAVVNDLAADSLALSLAGSGDVRASGRAARVKVSVAGSGDVQAADLKADDVSVQIAGSGDVSVHAAKTLAVSIAGSGDVVYGGEAAVTSSVAGSGRISRRR